MVSASDVKALRERSGAGMMDCKKALQEADGNIEKASELLREKGLAAAVKKAGRIAAEGVVGSYPHGRKNRRIGGSELRDRLCGKDRRFSGVC